MRKFLTVIGVLFLVLVLVVGLTLATFAYQGRGLDESSKKYIEVSVPTIASPWTKSQFVARASPQLLDLISKQPNDLDQLFSKLAKLGAMTKLVEVKGTSNVAYTTENGKQTTASYICHAKFEHGEGDISIRLIQIAGEWKYLYFHVDSPFFLQ